MAAPIIAASATTPTVSNSVADQQRIDGSNKGYTNTPLIVPPSQNVVVLYIDGYILDVLRSSAASKNGLVGPEWPRPHRTGHLQSDRGR